MTAVKIETLLGLLAAHGGAIVSSNSLHPDLIAQARASGRMYVDEKSLGYICEPPFAGRFPETLEEVKMFEWCYPLDVDMPEDLKSTGWIEKIINSPNDTVLGGYNKPVK